MKDNLEIHFTADDYVLISPIIEFLINYTDPGTYHDIYEAFKAKLVAHISGDKVLYDSDDYWLLRNIVDMGLDVVAGEKAEKLAELYLRIINMREVKR